MELIQPQVWILVRSILAASFLYAGVSKVANRAAFERSIEGYGLSSQALRRSLSLVLPPAEIALGLTLYSGVATQLSLIGAAGLLAGFSVALAWAIAHDRRDSGCGCFGNRGDRIGPFHVVRNLGLIALAVSILAFASGDGLYWPAWTDGSVGLDGVIVVILASASVVLIVGAPSLLSLFRGPGAARRRPTRQST